MSISICEIFSCGTGTGIGETAGRGGDAVERAGDVVERAGDAVERAGDVVERAGDADGRGVDDVDLGASFLPVRHILAGDES